MVPDTVQSVMMPVERFSAAMPPTLASALIVPWKLQCSIRPALIPATPPRLC